MRRSVDARVRNSIIGHIATTRIPPGSSSPTKSSIAPHLSAYAAVDPDGQWSEDWAQSWLDTGPAQPLPPDHPLAPTRPQIDRAILENLLRLNHLRASTPDPRQPDPINNRPNSPFDKMPSVR